MSLVRTRPRPLLIRNGPPRKHVDFEPPPSVAGNLSPDLQPNSPPIFPTNDCQNVLQIGKYILQRQLEANNLYKAISVDNREEYLCKVISVDKYRETLAAYWRCDSHQHINEIKEILLGETNAYVFFETSHGDLHSYVRDRRRLKEEEASRLFAQIILAVDECHENGIILRDLKLRKFVFKDKERTQLKLEGLEDSCVLDDDTDDSLMEKHGCPAYVSPEILNTNECYSGKAADIWSLGVMLYTMLVGRYPFHDTEPGALFTKIRRGHYTIPDTISSRAKCLIRSLLRRDPQERLSGNEILRHPWFSSRFPCRGPLRTDAKDCDQTVPDVFGIDDSLFFL